MPVLDAIQVCSSKSESMCRTFQDETLNMPPVISFAKFNFEESRYQRGNKCWLATTLLKAVKDQELEPFDYPVAGYDMSKRYFSLENMDDFCWQVRRTLAADYENYPIILDDYGQVADGNHRLCHAIIDGVATVKAYRLVTMPGPDFVEKE